MNPERRARWLLAIFIFVLVFLPLFSSAIGLLVDWIWFGAEGYRVLYLTVLKSQISMSTLAGVGFIAVVGLNLLFAYRIAKRQGIRVYNEVLEFPGLERVGEVFSGVIVAAVLLIGYAVAQWGITHWKDYLLAIHSVPTSVHDPIFGLSLSFYLFHLPFRWFLFHLSMVILIACLLSTVFLYLVQGGIWVTPKGPAVSPAARAHLFVLGGLLFLAIAYRIHLATYNLLFSARGVVFGAGYADVHASLPALRILVVLAVLTAAACFWGAFRGHVKPALWSFAALIAVAVVGEMIYPAIIQKLVVAPNELEKEKPFIANNIKFTRQAYALDRFDEHHFSATHDLTISELEDNTPTMRNVRLWDHKPLLTTFAQLQEIRTYYDFVGIDNDRYWINGNYRQVLLSPRELSTSSLPDRTWVNAHLIYTHGYGLCMSPVNEFTPDGLPVFFIENVPPVSHIPLKITQPEIYYGEVNNSYCFVKTRQQEFDYPSGEQDVYKNYQGTGGIPVKNFWRRLLFALNFGQKNILFSTDIRPDSRMMIYRQILKRAERLTPFLQYDPDPYMVITDNGTLYWILDAYTTSNMYPYSEPTGSMGNYIRNSVKVTINAYDGHARFYISDPTDPIIQVYSRIFPGVFKPLSDMPHDLRMHIRYPKTFFSIQAAKYAVYHMTDPRVFYNKEDVWRVAQSAARGPAAPMPPYYAIMKLAEVGKTEEFVLMVPFTPARKSNMIAWMAARCDAPNYGKVTVYTFPKQKLIYGPQQIESRIDQDPTISGQLTLWGQGGSTVIRGTLLVIPIGNAVLYIEPLYLAAQAGGALPQLKRVLVSYSDQVVMADTLDDALSEIFGGPVSTGAEVIAGSKPGTPALPSGEAVHLPKRPALHLSAAAQAAAQTAQFQALARQASQQYQRALQLQRQGDWAGYGQQIKKLGETLNKLKALKK